MKCPYCIKICSKCGEILVANNMNYGKEKTGKYGLKGKCKKCVNQYSKEYRQNNAEQIKEYKKEYCKNNTEQIKEYNKEYYKNNTDKIREQQKEYRKNNAEYFKEYRKNNAEKNKKQCKEYYKNNTDKIREQKKEYYKNNPDKVFNQCNKRRQRLENQGMGITKEQWLDMMKYFDFKCAYSGKSLNKDNRSIDHVKPLVKGGLNEIFNCVPCDRSINSSKQHKDFMEWYKEQEFYDESRLNKIYEWHQYCLETYYEYIKIS